MLSKRIVWIPPLGGDLKFNVDGAAKGKPGLAGIGRVLRNSDGVVFLMFSKHVGHMAEVVAILEALRIFAFATFNERFVVESDSLNAVSWASSLAKFPWRFQFYFNEIKYLSPLFCVTFQHIGRMANSFADLIVKQGVDRSSELVAFTM